MCATGTEAAYIIRDIADGFVTNITERNSREIFHVWTSNIILTMMASASTR